MHQAVTYHQQYVSTVEDMAWSIVNRVDYSSEQKFLGANTLENESSW